MRSVPGGPFQGEKQLPPTIQRNIERRFELDKPLSYQYFSHLNKIVFQFDFGPSYRLKDYTVNEVIASGFPVSMSLGVFALSFALVLGVSAGVVSAMYRHSVWDVTLMTVATLGIAVPNFVLASLCLIVFVFYLGILPAAGWSSLESVLLPAFCLGAPFAAYIARLTRTGMLEILNQDYIRTAYAKGLTTYSVVTKHALKMAIIPVVSYLGPATAGILTGSLVLERIFAIPGMGTHFVEAALQRDYTLAMGMILVYTLILSVMNTLVDMAYAMLDPRVKLE